MVTVNFNIEGQDLQLQGQVTVPVAPTRVDDLLPLARSVADRLGTEISAAVVAAGEQISCKKGCGACCRTLVAISEIEARRLVTVIENLTEPRRTEIRRRFVDAAKTLEQAGLLEMLLQPESMTLQQYNDIMTPYFKLGIPCPFLEQESCSIYTERPITCRECLVTSPAEYCAKTDSADVVRVRLPVSVFNATARWNVSPGRHVNERWVALTLSPQWVQTHTGEPPLRPGRELLAEFMELLKTPVVDQGL